MPPKDHCNRVDQAISINEHEFAEVEDDATRIGEAVLLRVGEEPGLLGFCRGAVESQLERAGDLLIQIGSFGLQSSGEMFRLI